MIRDIENEDDFIRETERFISKFEMSFISNTPPYSTPFSNLKEYLHQSMGYSYYSYPYLNISYLYELLESIQYAYINVDKGNDFLHSSLYNHLAVLLKTDLFSLENEEEEEENDDDDGEDDED